MEIRSKLTPFGVRFRVDDGSPEAWFASPTVERVGPYSIVGNVRLDARAVLLARLPAAKGHPSDLALCLRAYDVFGERFIDYIAGDFCFALWDESRRCLVAARDRLGIRPLFHASAGGTTFVSDSLDWIMTHETVPRDLDDTWIGDFLVVGFSLDFDRTVRRQVRRVPPAHILKISAKGETLRRYWQLEIAEPIRFKDRQLYTERFLDLTALAIKDRLPAGRVGISMSGGLDSTTLAACTVAATGDPSRVVALCDHFERLMPDDEAHFGSLAARRLGIELRLRAVDDLFYDPQWRHRGACSAEPTLSIVQTRLGEQGARAMAEDAKVWFYGEGPDNALPFDRNPYFSWLLARKDWRGLGQAAFDYAWVKGIAGWRSTLVRHFGPPGPGGFPGYSVPSWINPDFARRIRLSDRLRDVGEYGVAIHPWHPRAVGSFRDPIWPALFDNLRMAETDGTFEWRHPFLDLRVLEYMIALPPVPWAWRKHLLRQAMRGRLPDEVLARNKSPLARAPLLGVFSEQSLPALAGNRRFGQYVNSAEMPPRHPMPIDPDCVVAAHALDYWLMQE